MRAGSARGSTAAKGSARSNISKTTSGKAAGGVVKTIILPHEDVNRLASEA